MPLFRYIAVDSLGRQLQGELEATDRDAAQRQLTLQGLVPSEIVSTAEEVAAPHLSSREAEQVVVVMAELSDSQLPLAEGLRAAAAECPNRSVATALRHVAQDVESGYSLESILSNRHSFLPSHVRGLIVAASRTNRLGLVLDELVEHHRIARDTWIQIAVSLAYPMLVLAIALLLFGVLQFFIVPMFKQMFLEFELQLPAATQFIIGFSDLTHWLIIGPGKWLLLLALGAATLLMLVLRQMFGASWGNRVLARIPLLGPIWLWNRSAAFARLLAAMLEHGIPLNQSLELVGDSMKNRAWRSTARLWAEGAGQGRSLSDLMWASHEFPPTAVPFVRWGEKSGQLPAALRTVNDMLLERIRIRTLLLKSIGSPLIFVFLAGTIGFCAVSLFLPMVGLIQGLS